MATATAGRPAIDKTVLRDVLYAAIKPAMDEIGKAETKAIEAHLSVPVTRGVGGRVIRRSDPGDAPEKDEDILRQNIEWHVTKEDGEPVLYITASRPPQEPDDDPDAAAILEFGGESNWGYVQPRPFMQPALDRMADYAPEVIAKHLATNLK
jgi:hypothetical protein